MSQQPLDPQFEQRVRESFAQQSALRTLGATLESVTAGEVRIIMPFDPRFTQQHGYLHAGAVTTLVDTACGYAALTLSAAGSNVLTIEFKVNFLRPAVGESFVATGRVVKAGRTITVCQGEVLALRPASEPVTVAVMQATMMLL